MRSFEKIFLETAKHHLENFKIMIRGEFEIKSEDITEFTHEFKVESDHINSALKELGKQINIAVLEKCKKILNDIRFEKMILRENKNGE